MQVVTAVAEIGLALPAPAVPPAEPAVKEGYRESELGQKLADFIVWLGPILDRYPARERHLLVKETREALWKALRAYSDSRFAREKGKLPFLNQMDRDMAFAKLLLREARERQYIRDKKYREVFIKASEVGRLLGGMLKKYDPKKAG